MQKIFVDKTNICAFKNMIKSINEEEKNMIIVPDKFSLNSEQLFFEQNGISASFSTQTSSLTKLASKVLEKTLQNKQIIDKNISIMIISSIISENLNKFTYFKNIKNINEFSSDVFDFLSQVLSSKVENFNENLPQNLKNKIDDINFIIKEYKKRQKNLLVDASFKFELFLKEIKNSELIRETNFYFGMFNSLTNQVKDIIKEISKYAKSVSFSASKIENRVNNNEIFDFYCSLSKNNQIFEQNSLGEMQNFVLQNFFSASNKKFNDKNQKITLFEAKTVDEEIENVVYEIKKDVFLKNLRLKDIAICLGDFDNYSQKLKEKFLQINFAHFFDESKSLLEFGYSRFIVDLLKCFNNFSVKDILNLLKSGYIFVEKEKVINFENFLQKFDIQSFSEKDKLEFLKLDNNFCDYVFVIENFVAKILDFKSNLAQKSVNQFFNDFDNLLENFGSKKCLNAKIEALKSQDMLLFKQFSQLESKIDACFKNVCEFCEGQVDIQKIIYFVSICFENTTISLPPTSVDAIFVGNANSYFKTYKKLYVVGMDANFPKLTTDGAIFSENELEMIEFDEKINPKPSLVNKLSFFKCLEILLCFENELTMSYSTNKNQSQNFPSIFLKNFLKFFETNQQPKKMLKVGVDSLDLLENEEILNLISLKFLNFDDFIKNYYTSNAGKLKNVLKTVIQDKTNWNFETFEDKIDKNLIEINKFSASSLENYFVCSQKFLFKNVLNLTPKDKVIFDARVVGNIVHECAKSLADFVIDGKTPVEENFENLIENVLSQKKYAYFQTLKNEKAKIDNLKGEILKLFRFIVSQQNQSEFKISKAEFGFSELVDGNIFKGFVDRVDESDDGFIIVDYKTGSTKIEYSDIIIGKKVQLLLYAKILEQKLKKPCRGVFYLSVSDDYSSTNKHKIYFNGICVNADNTMKKLGDENYFEFKEKFLLSKIQFEKLENYVFDKVNLAIKNIKNAQFCENPIAIDDFCECDFCDYYEICAKKEKNYFEFDENMIKEILDD